MGSPKPIDSNKQPIDLGEARAVATSLSLTPVTFGRYLLVMRSECDLVISGEPYVALMLWLDAEAGKYVARVWNQTVSAGSATKLDQFVEACQSHFMSGRPCIGFPRHDCKLEFFRGFFRDNPFLQLIIAH